MAMTRRGDAGWRFGGACDSAGHARIDVDVVDLEVRAGARGREAEGDRGGRDGRLRGEEVDADEARRGPRGQRGLVVGGLRVDDLAAAVEVEDLDPQAGLQRARVADEEPEVGVGLVDTQRGRDGRGVRGKIERVAVRSPADLPRLIA